MTHFSGEVALVAGQGNARDPGEVTVVASGRSLFETYIRRFWPLRKAPEERGLGPRCPPVGVLWEPCMSSIHHLSVNVFVTPVLFLELL